MTLSAIAIDRFRGADGFRLGDLCSGLTVFRVPNGGGKSTVADFARADLLGEPIEGRLERETSGGRPDDLPNELRADIQTGFRPTPARVADFAARLAEESLLPERPARENTEPEPEPVRPPVLRPQLEERERREIEHRLASLDRESGGVGEAFETEATDARRELDEIDREIDRLREQRRSSRQPETRRPVPRADLSNDDIEAANRVLASLVATDDQIDAIDVVLGNLQRRLEALGSPMSATSAASRQQLAAAGQLGWLTEIERRLSLPADASGDCDCHSLRDTLRDLQTELVHQRQVVQNQSSGHSFAYQSSLCDEQRSSLTRCLADLRQQRAAFIEQRAAALELAKSQPFGERIGRLLVQDPASPRLADLRGEWPRYAHIFAVTPDAAVRRTPEPAERAIRTRDIDAQIDDLERRRTGIEKQIRDRDTQARGRRDHLAAVEQERNSLRFTLSEDDLNREHNQRAEREHTAKQKRKVRPTRHRGTPLDERIARLTLGRHTAIRLRPEFALTSADGKERTTEQLSRGTLEQVALALRLTAAESLARGGRDIFLIFDEGLCDADIDRTTAAVQELKTLGDRGLQLLVFTSQPQVVDSATRAGVATAGFPPLERERSQTAASASSRWSSAIRASETRSWSEQRTESSSTFEPRSGEQSSVRDRGERSPRLAIHQPTSRTANGSVQSSRTSRLRPGDEVSRVPSVSAASAERLRAARIRTAGDLAAASDRVPGSLRDHLTSRQWRRWRSEAALLLRLPNLDRRAAQSLAELGVRSSNQLANTDGDRLWRRLRERSRRSRSSRRRRWGRRLRSQDVDRWIRSARRERRWRSSGRGRSFDRRICDLPRWVDPLTDRHSERTERQSRTDRTRTPRPRPDRRERTERADRRERSDREKSWRFYLEIDSPIVDAPSIGPKTAKRLRKIGVHTVQDLLVLDVEAAAGRLSARHLTAGTLRSWQTQACLQCRVPELRGHDVQILAACAIESPDDLLAFADAELLEHITPFVESPAGQRVIRSGKAPDLAECGEWIAAAEHARALGGPAGDLRAGS